MPNGIYDYRAFNMTRFTIPSDDAPQANIHILVHNLFVPEPGRRTVKRQKERSWL
jgi:hypothetical protein